MRAAVVSSSFLFRAGNWSAGFLIPFSQLVDSLKEEPSDHQVDLLEQIFETFNSSQKTDLGTLIEQVEVEGGLTVMEAAEKARKIFFRNAKATVLNEKQTEVFTTLIVRWLIKKWNSRAVMQTGQLVTRPQPTARQHTKPCADCPWSRKSLKGWTGDQSPEQWLVDVRNETKLICHTCGNQQCAGAAIFRRNICKRPRDPDQLVLERDTELVFANPQEFLQHHGTTRV